MTGLLTRFRLISFQQLAGMLGLGRARSSLCCWQLSSASCFPSSALQGWRRGRENLPAAPATGQPSTSPRTSTSQRAARFLGWANHTAGGHRVLWDLAGGEDVKWQAKGVERQPRRCFLNFLLCCWLQKTKNRLPGKPHQLDVRSIPQNWWALRPPPRLQTSSFPCLVPSGRFFLLPT